MSLLESDAPPDNSIPNPVDAGPTLSEDDVKTEGAFKAEDLQDEADEEAPPEDHVVQLRCVLEIINTGEQCLAWLMSQTSGVTNLRQASTGADRHPTTKVLLRVLVCRAQANV